MQIYLLKIDGTTTAFTRREDAVATLHTTYGETAECIEVGPRLPGIEIVIRDGEPAGSLSEIKLLSCRTHL